MKSKIIAILAVSFGFIVTLPDGVGRWTYLNKMLRESGVISHAQERSGQDFRWTGRLPAGQSLAVQGVNGSITAESAAGDEIEVVARKSAKRDNPDDVRIEVVQKDGGLVICAVYPSRPGDQPNECGVRMNAHNNDVKVDFTVKVPAGLNFKASNVNGDVKATNLRANVKASTVNGDVDVSTSGEAQASAVNGDIHASLGQSDSDAPLKFSTVNGDVYVSWGPGINATFNASTVNGKISSDFGFDSYEGKYGPKSATGRIGQGGRKVKLSTVNGDIKLNSSGKG
jgi:hypothetical protein